MKTFLTAFVIAVLPGLALAAGCSSMKPDQTAASCAQGYSWDTQTQSCIVATTS